MSAPATVSLAVLSVSAGAGHVRCAEALVHAAQARGVAATHLDLMTMVPAVFRQLYVGSYLAVVNRRPALWGYLYDVMDSRPRESLLSRVQRAVERLNTRRLDRELDRLAPTHIVCTHFLPAQVLSRQRATGRRSTPTWVVVTDFDLHALWVHPQLSGYCAAADEVAWRMQDRGLTETPRVVTGIPIMPAFATPPTRAAAAAELGLDPSRPTLLLMSGGLGVGNLDALAERLLALPHGFQLIALAGRNEALLARLRTLATRDARLLPMGFTSRPEVCMAAADLAISKPGGLTTSECLALGLPMVVIAPIPGQEERNSDYLLEHGAALKAHDLTGLVWRVRGLLDDPVRLARLRASAQALGRPNAADAVLDAVLSDPATSRPRDSATTVPPTPRPRDGRQP